MAKLPSEALKKLENHPWEKILPKMALYAENLLKIYKFYGVYGREVIFGKSGEDIVTEVIIKIYKKTNKK